LQGRRLRKTFRHERQRSRFNCEAFASVAEGAAMPYARCPTAIVNAPVGVVWALLADPGGWDHVFDVRINSVDPPGPAVCIIRLKHATTRDGSDQRRSSEILVPKSQGLRATSTVRCDSDLKRASRLR
jgi:hypothetical protein